MRRADNLTTFMCRMSWNLRPSTSWNPKGLSRPVMVYLYLLPSTLEQINKQNRSNNTVFNNLQLFLIRWCFKIQWQLYIPPALTLRKNEFCLHGVFIRFVWESERTAFISVQRTWAVLSLKYNQEDATSSPSIYFYKFLCMFQAVPPPIIRSTKLYIQRQVLTK